MTVEELLKPRYKVIADYPGSHHAPGVILYPSEISNGFVSDITSPLEKEMFAVHYPDKYPHLFKRLEWWEGRKPEEMPKYLKSVEPSHQFVTLDRPYISFFEGGVNGQYIEAPYYEFLPATEAEYLAFINNQTPTK